MIFVIQTRMEKSRSQVHFYMVILSLIYSDTSKDPQNHILSSFQVTQNNTKLFSTEPNSSNHYK